MSAAVTVPNNFFARLEDRSRDINSLLCVGLDPHPAELGSPEEQTAEAAAVFCERIIKATSAVAAAYKPNAAFFEAYGAPGVAALERVIAAVPKGIPVLLDAKRGDIGSTAAAYAAAAFEHLQVIVVTRHKIRTSGYRRALIPWRQELSSLC